MQNYEHQRLYRLSASADLVLRFNSKYKDSVVYLKLVDESESAAFQIHFKLNDPFVQSEIYDRGNAVIYPSDLVYQEIQRIAGSGVKINWNNTGTIGWFSF